MALGNAQLSETSPAAIEETAVLANGALEGEGETKAAPAAAKTEAAAEDAKPEAAAEGSRAINPLMGAVALMLASPQYRHLFLADLEWRLLPPLALKQYRFFMKDGKPLGLVTWALLSEAVMERLKSEPGGRLQPQDWRSGGHFTIVDVVAPSGGGKEMREAVMKMAQKAAEGGGEVSESEETKANEDDS